MQNIFASLFDEVTRAWRYRWFGLWTAGALAIIGAVVVLLLPNYYTSQAKIYLNTQTLLQPLLQGIAVESNLRGQLDLVQKTLLSDPNLENIARTVDTGMSIDTGAGLERAKDSLRNRIAVAVEGQDLFSVTFDDTEPKRAHDVVETLLKIFFQSNLRQSLTESQGAREFIDKQIADYEKQLRAAELALAEYRVDHPEIVGTEGVSTRVDTTRAAFNTAQLDYRQAVAWRDQLTVQLRAMEKGEATGVPSTRTLDDQRITETIDRINTLRTELETLRRTYTENHPDVIARRRELEALVSQFSAGETSAQSSANQTASSGGASGTPATVTAQEAVGQPSGIDDMRLRVIQAEALVLKSERALEKAQTDLRSVETISNASNGSNRLADLTSDYQIMKSNYDELLKRRESARISQAVGTTPGVVPYRVVVPPSVPSTPSKPNRPLWLAVASLGAIVGGCVGAFLRALNAGTFVRPEEIETSFGLPVVGAVSRVEGMFSRVGRTAETATFMLSLGGLVVALALLVFVTSQFDAWREQAYRAFDSIMQSAGPTP
jgi:polysaccharide chain length determinant protein (PEP-CTERM system associated)